MTEEETVQEMMMGRDNGEEKAFIYRAIVEMCSGESGDDHIRKALEEDNFLFFPSYLL